MTPASEDHRNAMFVARRDYFIVAARAPRLDDRAHARSGGLVNRIVERKKSVGSEHCTPRTIAGFFDGNFNGIYAAHLASSGTDKRLVFHQHDRVRLYVSAYGPCETQVGELCVGWLLFGN